MADNLLVNRDGQTYQVDMENTKSIQDTDLLLVNRNGTTYTVAGSEISRGDFSEVVITPTSIIPEPSEQILTAVTDIPKVGSNVPADVFWTWYEYDGATGTAGQRVLKTLTNREASDTLVLPAASANKYIGCSVEYLAVTISETERCAVGQPPGPVAVMSGLRFDSGRQTYLNRTPESDGNRKTWTWSGWVKVTEIGAGLLLAAGDVGLDNGTTLRVAADSKIYIYQRTGGAYAAESNTPSVAVDTSGDWVHIVASVDTNQSTNDEIVKIYVNGVQSPLNHKTGWTSIQETYVNSDSYVHSIGANADASSSVLNGYLSDVYFTDGYVLPPTVFGEQFAQGWGPLDKTQVEENFKQYGPVNSDYRANTNQVWSTYMSSSGALFSGSFEEMFDGDITTSGSVLGNSMTFSPPGGYSVSSEISFFYSSDQTTQYRINNGDWVDIPPSTGVDKFTGSFSGNLTSIEWNAPTASELISVYFVVFDNILLVDDGVFNKSQIWSLKSSGDANNIQRAFNGYIENNYQTAQAASMGQAPNGGSLETVLSFKASVTSKIEIHSRAFMNERADIYVGNTLLGVASGSGNDYSWSSFSYSGNIDESNPLRIVNTQTDRAFLWNGIKIDDQVLVDDSVPYNTNQVWSDLTAVTNIYDIHFIESLFDGSYSGIHSNSPTPLILNWDPGTIVGEVEVVFRTAGTPGDASFKDNNGNSQNISLPANSQYILRDLGNINLTELSAPHPSGGNAVYVMAIRLNGELLVDHANYGRNGFMLPFDPSVPVSEILDIQNSSTNLQTTYAQWPALFDGTLPPDHTQEYSSQCVRSNSNSTFRFKEPLTGTFEIRVSTQGGSFSSGGSIDIRDQDNTLIKTISGISQSTEPPGNPQWKSAGYLANVKRMDFKRGGDVSSNIIVSAIKLNGTVLTEYSNIGIDASGKGNDYLDQNFVPNYGVTSSKGFNAVLYTGTGEEQSIDCGFKPDFVWIKRRSNTSGHQLIDSVRGATKALIAQGTDAEVTRPEGLKSFDTNGFTIGTLVADYNAPDSPFVAWCWKAGDSTAINNDGDIETTVSHNADYGFSILTYNGNGTAGSTLGHGLGERPSMFITKQRNGTGAWYVWHMGLDYGKTLILNSNDAQGNSAWLDDFNPNSSVIEIGDAAAWNSASGTYAGYFWSEVPGFSKFGRYTGNGSATGPTIKTGFPPKYLLIKRIDSPADWAIIDAARGGDKALVANGANPEGTDNFVAFLEDGFQLTYTGAQNQNGGRYIYAAFADKIQNVDQVLDTPMNNYAVLSPDKGNTGLSPAVSTVSNGNLVASASTNSDAVGTFGVSTGKWYYEVTNKRSRNNGDGVGFVDLDTGNHAMYRDGGDFTDNTVASAFGDSWRNIGDVIGVVLDLDNTSISFYKNGVNQGTAKTDLPEVTYHPCVINRCSQGDSELSVNFGQQPFVYASDNGNGTVTFNGEDPVSSTGTPFNTSQIWSNLLNISQASDTNNPVGTFRGTMPTSNTGVASIYVIHPAYGDSNASATLPITLNNSTVRLTYAGGGNEGRFDSFVCGDQTSTTEIDNGDGTYSVEVSGATGSSIVINFTRVTGLGSTTWYLYQYEVDGEILVDAVDKTPKSKLYQTWSQWVIQTLVTKSAEADALKAMLLDHAQTYQAAEDYCEGSVIQAFGELWIAVNDAPATTFADLPALRSHPNWERLNISAN